MLAQCRTEKASSSLASAAKPNPSSPLSASNSLSLVILALAKDESWRALLHTTMKSITKEYLLEIRAFLEKLQETKKRLDISDEISRNIVKEELSEMRKQYIKFVAPIMQRVPKMYKPYDNIAFNVKIPVEIGTDLRFSVEIAYPVPGTNRLTDPIQLTYDKGSDSMILQ